MDTDWHGNYFSAFNSSRKIWWLGGGMGQMNTTCEAGSVCA